MVVQIVPVRAQDPAEGVGRIAQLDPDPIQAALEEALKPGRAVHIVTQVRGRLAAGQLPLQLVRGRPDDQVVVVVAG